MSDFSHRNVITVHGRLGAVPKLVASGEATTTTIELRVAVDDGYRDRQTGRWVERPTVWHTVLVFGELAEHTYDSLMASDDSGKGLLVVVTGSFSDDSYTRESFRPDGEDITIHRLKLRATDVAVSFRRATAVVRKIKRDAAAAAGARADSARPDSTCAASRGTGSSGSNGPGSDGAGHHRGARVAPPSRRTATG